MIGRPIVAAGLCVLGMTILGSSVSLNRLILDYPTLTGQAMRYAASAAVLAGIVWLARRPAPAAVRGRDLAVLVALAGTGLVAFNIFLLIAVRHADAAVVGTVVGAAPLGIALTWPLLQRQRPAPRLVIAAAIVVAGTALVYGAGHANLVGTLAAFGALGGEVAFSVLAAAALPRFGAVRVSAMSCALAVPMLVIAAIATGETDRFRMPTPVEAGTLAYLALGLTVVAFLAWFTGIGRLGVTRAGLFVGVLPVATLLTTSLQDGRAPAAAQAAGVAVVALGLGFGLTRSG